MNQLITTPIDAAPDLPSSSNYCGKCGNRVIGQENFCRHCGHACHEVVIAELIASDDAPSLRPAPTTAIGNVNPYRLAIQQSLNNRLLVISIVALLGPIGLPALWISPRFRPTTKTIVTVLYLLLTIVVPVVVTWYFLENAFQPISDIMRN